MTGRLLSEWWVESSSLSSSSHDATRPGPKASPTRAAGRSGVVAFAIGHIVAHEREDLEAASSMANMLQLVANNPPCGLQPSSTSE